MRSGQQIFFTAKNMGITMGMPSKAYLTLCADNQVVLSDSGVEVIA